MFKYKKQIVVGVIGMILLGTVGIFWYVYQMRVNVNNSVSEGQNADAEKLGKSSMVTPTDFIEVDGITVGLAIPAKWGHLVVPKLDQNNLVMNAPKGMPQNQQYFSSRSSFTFDFGDKNSFTKMFSGYSYSGISEHAGSLPEITLLRVPQNFQDDTYLEGPGAGFTAWRKKEGIEFLRQIWRKQSVDITAIEQACWGTPEYEKRNANCFKEDIFWWAVNSGSVRDRVAVKYIESGDGQFRGVGFFSVVGQDTPFGIDSYRVILFNADNKIAIQMVFPLQGEEFISKEDRQKNLTDEELTARVDRGYAYIRDPKNYQGSELGQLMQDIQNVVDSLQIRSNDAVSIGDDFLTEKNIASTKYRFMPTDSAIYSHEILFGIPDGGERGFIEQSYSKGGPEGSLLQTLDGGGTWNIQDGKLLIHGRYSDVYSSGDVALSFDAGTNELIQTFQGKEIRWKRTLTIEEEALLGTWMPDEGSVADVYSIEGGKRVYKIVSMAVAEGEEPEVISQGTWTIGMGSIIQVEYKSNVNQGKVEPATIALSARFGEQDSQLIYNDEGTESIWKKIK